MKLSFKKIGDFAKKNPLLIILGIVLLLCIFTPVVNKITETFKEGRRNKKRKKKVKKQSIRAAQQPVNTADMAEKNLQTGMREKFKLSKKRQ